MSVHRRHLLVAGAMLPLAVWTAPPVGAAPALPVIRPRSAWAKGLMPTGTLMAETDVRFLLIHHTETPNTDAPDDTAQRLRSIFSFHTGRQRGWPDVAYNFFVDRHGVIWEGRQGSIAGPVRGDATGGSQGFAELACFVGDFTAETPTEEALTSMSALLAWLAARNGLDLTTPATFVSRGSNRWRAGAQVTTDQIAGHRDMSRTACPGDALYPLLAARLQPAAVRLLHGTSPATASPEADATASAPPAPSPTPTSPPVASEGPAPTEAIQWAGAALTVAGAAGVALASHEITGEPDERRVASAQEQEGQDDAAEHDGEQQPDDEPAQGR